MNEIDAILEPYQKEVEGALFLGFPIAQLSDEQLRAALVMMGKLLESDWQPQMIELSSNGKRITTRAD